MDSIRRLFAGLTIALVAFAATGCEATESIRLRVALYPFVPDRYAVFALLAREFQRRNDGVVIDLIEVPSDQDYYDGGLAALDADVYEIDSILLSDILAKLAPLDISLDRFAPESVAAVTRNKAVYAIPHWLCGNFLFYRKSDTSLRDAVTWEDVTTSLGRQKKALLFDMFGRLTLGEWYITMLADRVGISAAETAIVSTNDLDRTVVQDLNSILAGCPTGSCRSTDLHDRTGYYARAFMRGEAGAYVGYSESFHYALQEAINNCRPGSACLSGDEVAVRRLPRLSPTSTGDGVGWVDGLAISRSATGATKDAAVKFIAFATSADGYKLILEPGWMEAPRYLLPALTDVALGPNTPLYRDFLAAHAGRKTGTAPALNTKLHALAPKLNCALPIDRTDSKSAGACSKF